MSKEIDSNLGRSGVLKGIVAATSAVPLSARFEAHFVPGEDLEDPAVIDAHAHGSAVALAALHARPCRWQGDGSGSGDSDDRPRVRRPRHTGLAARPTIDYGTPPGSGI
jgi:hypothetical protein